MLIDIHTHILPNVDDGSNSIEMSEKMIQNSVEENVKSIFLTPHVNSSVREENIKKSHRLNYEKILHFEKKYNIKLILGSEIYISQSFPEFDFSQFTLGNSKFLLVEFSTYHNTQIFEHTFNLIKSGYSVIIAHVERYRYLSKNDLLELKSIGAFLQLNCSSILNRKNRKMFNKSIQLIKNNLVDFISSDSHNLTSRPSKMNQGYEYIKKKFNIEIAENLFYRNAQKILN